MSDAVAQGVELKGATIFQDDGRQAGALICAHYVGELSDWGLEGCVSEGYD